MTLTIDGHEVRVPKGTTVYQAAKHAGIEIPIFCYHDRMPPLGACRMCLVKVEKMPRLQTSCTLEGTDGMVVSTTSPEVVAGQEAILEYLLVNHPLDCPICDKGGECPLQDQAFRWGPGRSRFVEVKRDYAKPVSLGPVLVLDRERCILCWRCVRFGELIAGDDALKGFERSFASEINTAFTLPVQSKFIGNTITICPVGALTAKSYRFISRPWDNREVSSVCTHCGVGCAVHLDVRGNSITRVRAREAPAVNDVWLCDLGFFGQAYVGREDRLHRPLVRRDGALVDATWDEALDTVARHLRAANGRAALLGGGRGTNEDAYVLGRFFRTVAGTNTVDSRVDLAPHGASAAVPWGMVSSIAELGTADVIVLAGCDITEDYPVLWLRMKQAVDRGAKIIAITPKRLEIDRFITHQLVHRYGVGAEVLAALLGGRTGRRRMGSTPGGVSDEALQAASAVLMAASRPIILIGRLALDAPDGYEALDGLQEICRRIGAPLNVMRGKSNEFGAALAGLLPDHGPGGRSLGAMRADLESIWGEPVASERGMTAPEMLEAGARGILSMLYVVGADPATAVHHRRSWTEARAGLPFLVVQDAFLTETAQAADVVLPALVIAEKSGTVSNIEGRVQRIDAAVQGPGEARGDWAILSQLSARLGRPIAYSAWGEIFDEMRHLIPGLEVDQRIPVRGIQDGFQARGPKPETPPAESVTGYPLTLVVGDVLFDRGAMTSRDPAIADLAGEAWVMIHPDDAARGGIVDGDAVVVSSPAASLALRARVSAAIARGDVYVPRGFDGTPVNLLTEPGRATTLVRVRAFAPAGVGGAGSRAR
ncbi:MAG TPA: NADH-quinone oxidoreductase subunit NuoG [bacterium]|jgi:NADH-quinone oxidoreductase subunit G